MLTAKDMQFRYKRFPYTFRRVTGRVVVTPGQVKLETLQSRHGKMTASISGTLRLSETGDDGRLRIVARNLPIDKELLAAIPADILPLAKRFRPGGLCDADIQEFTFTRRRAQAALEPPTISETLAEKAEKAKKPAPEPDVVDFTARGAVTFHGVTLDFGFGPRVLTGSIEG